MAKRVRRGYKKIVAEDLEIMPLMNLFVAMIPMLLISAVFLNVTVIDMKAPADATKTVAEPKERMNLAVTIKNDYFVIEGRQVAKKVIARADDDADAQLGDALVQIVQAHPDNQDVMIISQHDTNYGDIVAVMDISRESGLPSVALLAAQ